MYLSKEGKKLFKYYQQYEENFFLFLGKTMGNSDEENIHGFRVTIKKLKSVIKLMGLLTDEFHAKEQFATLKTLFKPAGYMRECQVNLKRLKDFPAYDEFYSRYKKARKKCMKTHRKNFDVSLSTFNPEKIKITGKLLKKHCKVLSSEEIETKSIAFIEGRINKIHKYHRKVEEDVEFVHEIRIKLKEISTVLGLLHTMQPEIVSSDKLAKLKKQEDQIGLWHDYDVLRNSINEFCDTNPADCLSLKEDIQTLIAEIEKEEAKFLIQLDSFVDETIKQVEDLIIPVSDTI